MAGISADEVTHLARLARIDLTDAERDRMTGQLSAVLDAVAQVQAVTGDDVPATSHPIPLANVTRPDEPAPCLGTDAALDQAPAAEQQRFRVPRILEEEQ